MQKITSDAKIDIQSQFISETNSPYGRYDSKKET